MKSLFKPIFTRRFNPHHNLNADMINSANETISAVVIIANSLSPWLTSHLSPAISLSEVSFQILHNHKYQTNWNCEAANQHSDTSNNEYEFGCSHLGSFSCAVMASRAIRPASPLGPMPSSVMSLGKREQM